MTPFFRRRKARPNAGGASRAGASEDVSEVLVADAGTPSGPAPGSVNLRVAEGGVGAGRDIAHSALGDNSSVVDNSSVHYHLPPPAGPVSWPVQLGPLPPLASAFQPRSALRQAIAQGRQTDGRVVLTQVISGGGGVGKTQLAGACAADALNAGTDLVMWVPAGEANQVITSYAQAAARVHAPGTAGDDLEADARCFLEWLATTDHTWLIVLDDITNPTALAPWWPPTNRRTGASGSAGADGGGWTVATTRLRDAVLTGGGRTLVNIDVYASEEAVAYLTQRLATAGAAHLLDEAAGELAEALGYLPLALSHAAAYMTNQDTTCRDYLALFTDQRRRLAEALPADADADGYGRHVDAALLLSLDAANQAEPAGLARPALALAALLDPAGHPDTLWTTQAITIYLTTSAAGEDNETVDAPRARSAMRLLHRYGLLTHAPASEHTAVRIHALTARAAQETTSEAELETAARAAADALLEVWPDDDHEHPDLSAALRANTEALNHHAGHRLWSEDDGCHLILFHTSHSLSATGLYTAIVTYDEHLATTAERILGPHHPHTLAARNNLASSYWHAGRTQEAITLQEAVLTDLERTQGPHHPDTLTTRANLATSYADAGRTQEAVTLQEAVLTDRERTQGPHHPQTFDARNHLATSYADAGRTQEAITLQEAVLADRERTQGPHHPDTLNTRNNLAISYWQAGRAQEAITLQEAVLADRERTQGPHHPHTLNTRNNLATFYAEAGRAQEAVTLQEAVLADRERILGPHHPHTLNSRHSLATFYAEAGRAQEAVLADRERTQGPHHPDTLTTRRLLEEWKQQQES
ncbi:tetratricopeptide repeat protein [Streptomyces mayteni]